MYRAQLCVMPNCLAEIDRRNSLHDGELMSVHTHRERTFRVFAILPICERIQKGVGNAGARRGVRRDIRGIRVASPCVRTFAAR